MASSEPIHVTMQKLYCMMIMTRAVPETFTKQHYSAESLTVAIGELCARNPILAKHGTKSSWGRHVLRLFAL